MIQKMSHTTVHVLDQDSAKRFYTEKLGFEVRMDERMGEFRWLTVGSKTQADLEIVLMPIQSSPMLDAERAARGLLTVGFSAGAMLTMATTLGGSDAKPAFIGDIYGPLDPVTVPADAPPLFVALAADDPLFAGRGTGLIDSWLAAKKPVEFHLYGQGGHGFGMYPKETTSTGWFDAFYRWIVMNGFTKAAAS